MFIQDEVNSKQLFARVRVGFDVQVLPIPKSSDEGQAILADMQSQHGKIVQMLSGLDDFALYELTPVRGRYVKGFGQAYALQGKDLSDMSQVHLTDGHRRAAEA